MRHLQDPPREWPAVRMWTAIAWVLVGWTFSFFVLTTDPAPHPLPPFFRGDPVPMPAAAMRQSVLWSGTLAILYGTLVFFWGPPSPPLATGRRVERTPLRQAFSLLRIRSFAVIVAATLVMSSVHVIYFIQCAKFLSAAGLRDAYIMPSMALGQLCEIGMYVVLGRMLPRFGFRTVICIGISCFVLRFALLGTVSLPLWVMVAAQALHGICFAFLFSACFIYTDKVAPRVIGNSAQSVYSFVFYGAGPVTGVFLNAFLAERFAGNAAILDLAAFSRLWYTLGVIAVVVLAFVVAFFRPEHLRANSAASSELAPATKGA
jgi:hypothetical protein